MKTISNLIIRVTIIALLLGTAKSSDAIAQAKGKKTLCVGPIVSISAIKTKANQIGKSLELEQEYEREPSTEELAEISDTTIKWIEDLVKAYSGPVSLEDSSIEDRPLIEYLTSSDPRPEMQLMQDSLKNEISNLVKTLKIRETQVLTEYYGLGEDDPKTLEQIGEILNLSSERVRQIKERALQRLRKSTRSQLLKLYLG